MAKKTLTSRIQEVLAKEISFTTLARRVEEALNAQIPGTPRLGARVMYVALPGTGRKSLNVLSPRAKQVMAYINRNRRASSGALQVALSVNRNVIAGAIHELKQAGFVRADQVGSLAAAGRRK